jgi:hypothetical protein
MFMLSRGGGWQASFENRLGEYRFKLIMLCLGFDNYFQSLVPSAKRECSPSELLDKKVGGE